MAPFPVAFAFQPAAKAFHVAAVSLPNATPPRPVAFEDWPIAIAFSSVAFAPEAL